MSPESLLDVVQARGTMSVQSWSPYVIIILVLPIALPLERVARHSLIPDPERVCNFWGPSSKF